MDVIFNSIGVLELLFECKINKVTLYDVVTSFQKCITISVPITPKKKKKLEEIYDIPGGREILNLGWLRCCVAVFPCFPTCV